MPPPPPASQALDKSDPPLYDRQWVVYGASILLVTLLAAAYYNSLQVPFLLDDADSIGKNTTIRSFATALFPPANSGITVSGRPLLNLSLYLNYRLGGAEPIGYHVVNILIHALSALALFGVLRRTLSRSVIAERVRQHRTPLAWFAAALWALHPLQTESVTYIIQRAESLVGLCYLATLYAFIRSIEHNGRSGVWTAITIIACFLGMAAKEVMVSAPLVIFLYDRTFVSGSFLESWRRHKTLHLTLASSWILLGALIASSGGRGSSVGFADTSWLDYLLTQGPGITTYIVRSLVPVDLVFDYGAIIEKRPLVLLGGVAVIGTLIIVTAVQLKARPALGFLGAWLVLILAPTSSIVPVATQTLAEHRMYLPLAAITLGITLVLHRLITKHYGYAAIALLGVLGVLTTNRNRVYHTSLSIWEDTVRKVPDNVRALNNVGLYYVEEYRADEAIHYLSKALELAPSYAIATCNLGRALIAKAQNETGQGKPSIDLVEGIDFGDRRGNETQTLSHPAAKKGLELMEEAIKGEPSNSAFLAQYANALLALGQPEAAVPFFERAIVAEPENPNLLYDLANAYARQDQNVKAAEQFEAVLRLRPNDAEALTNYGAVLRRMGRLPESVDRLQRACTLKPRLARAHSNLGVSLLESRRAPEAIKELEEALRLDPNLPQARYNLFSALADRGDTANAIVHLEALLKIAPSTAELVCNLGVLYARKDRLQDAVAEMRRALELDPGYEPARENLSKIMAYLRTHP